MTIETTPKVYVGTYAKYNAGNLFGEWVGLEGHNIETFQEYINNLHKDETDPEFMFQDYEGFPSRLYSECGGLTELFEYLEFCDNSFLDQAVIDAGLDLEIPLEYIEEVYQGQYDNDEDFAQQLAEDTGSLNTKDAWPYTCIDWERAAMDLMFDYSTSNGHYFSNNW